MVKPYTYFQSQGHVKYNLTEQTYCLIRCRENSTLNIFPCQAIVILRQGQGHRNEHEHMCPAYVYRHTKCECHS